MSVAQQAIAARRRARIDERYASNRRDPEAVRRKYEEKVQRERDRALRGKGRK